MNEREPYDEEDDIPTLIQSMRYNYGSMVFEVDFFDGLHLEFCAEDVSPSIGLMQKSPTRMQALEAENNINKLALRFWKAWHEPKEKVMSDIENKPYDEEDYYADPEDWGPEEYYHDYEDEEETHS
jgi:hypothetical protein